MRCLILGTLCNTTDARRIYLEKATKLWFIVKKHETYDELVSFPDYIGDVAFVVGHTNAVDEHSSVIMSLKERILVFVTCFGYRMQRYGVKTGKILYSTILEDNKAEQYDGREFGFDFKITKSEIEFYNYKKLSLMDRIDKAFVRI